MGKDKQPFSKGAGLRNVIRFNLKSLKKKNKLTLISAVFRYNGEKLVYSTKQKIEPKYWSSSRMQPSPNYILHNELVTELDRIKKAILIVYKENPSIAVSAFKHKLDVLLGRKAEIVKIEHTVLGYIDSSIKTHEKLNDISNRTIQKYKTIRDRLEAYETKKGEKLQWQDFTVEWKNNYVSYLYNHKGSKVNSRSTVNKELAIIKAFLKAAYRAKINKYDDFLDPKFMEQRAKKFHVAPTESDVKALENVKLSNDEMIIVRDWFLVACWSGLRISDFMEMSKSNFQVIEGENFLRFITYKTTTEVYIPVSDKLKALLEKYNFTSPEVSEHEFNKTIKKVSELAKLTYTINIVEDVKGDPVPKTYRRCDKISSHDGRRFWATTMYMKGFPIGLLMQVTGHSKESTFLSYIGISNKAKALQLSRLIRMQKESAKVVDIKSA